MNESTFNKDEFRTWLLSRVAGHLKRQPSDIDVNAALADYGLDSLYALALVSEIEDYLGITIDATMMWDYPSVAALTSALATQISAP